MALNPIQFVREVNNQFRRYQLTAFPIADPDLDAQARTLLAGDPLGATPLVRGPYLSIGRAFEMGDKLAELAARGTIHSALAAIAEHPQLFAHQQLVLEAVARNRHVLLSTGTGSGKTEAFLYPIINHCLHLRDSGDPNGVAAVLVYPMNALAADQRDRLRVLLAGTGITYGMYTGPVPQQKAAVAGVRLNDGDGPAALRAARQHHRLDSVEVIPFEECASRDEILERKPRILITNAAQLELLLTRERDLSLFVGAPLRFLVLDEAHTYSGAAGAEVAVLMRRLRAFVGRRPEEVACIATSATIVDPEHAEAAAPAFLSRLFGVPENDVALINERYIAPDWPHRRVTPALPAEPEALLDRVLSALGDSESGEIARAVLVPLVEELTGMPLAAAGDIAETLWEHLAGTEIIRWLAEELVHAISLDDAVRRVWTKAARPGTPGPAARAEILTYLALAAVAERGGAPLLRPKMHVFVRGMEGAVAAFDGEPAKPRLYLSASAALADSTGRRPESIFPISVCRTCGQHYFTAAMTAIAFKDGKVAEGQASRDTVVWTPSNAATNEDVARIDVRFTDRLLTEMDTDEETSVAPFHFGRRQPLWLCRHCGTLHLDDVGSCAIGPCGRAGPLVSVQVVTTDPGKFRCLGCGEMSRRRGSRVVEPIRQLRAVTVADVHILAQEMINAAPSESEQRLLIFADNRQDAAFQAGWMRDHARRYRLRYLVRQAIEERDGPVSIGDIHRDLYDRLRVDRELARALAPEAFTSDADEAFGRAQLRDLSRFLRIQVLQEFTTRMNYRESLERWGLARVHYDSIYATEPRVAELASELNMTAAELVDGISTMLDLWRRAGSFYDADEPIYARWWRDGDEDILRGFVPSGLTGFPPKGIKLRRDTADKQQHVTALLSSKGRTTTHDFVSRWGVVDPVGTVEAIWRLVSLLGLLRPVQLLSSSNRPLAGAAGAHHVDSAKVGVVPSNEVWRCGSCQRVHARCTPKRVCTKRFCKGLLSKSEPARDDYNIALLDRPFSLVRPEEHTAQVPPDRRSDIEREFKRPSGRVNTLVATPTLELGVDIGALDLVLLRNVPPTSANYWQRVGRAGRRRRMAVLYTYCRRAVHDSYFFEDPQRLLGASVRPPRFNLKNDVLIAKNTHSTVVSELLRLRQYGQLSDDQKAVLDTALPAYVRSYLFDGLKYRQRPPRLRLAEVVAAHRERLLAAVEAVFAEGWPQDAQDEVGPETIAKLVDGMGSALQDVVDTIHQRFWWTVVTKQHLDRAAAERQLESEEERQRARCSDYLMALAQESITTYTLGVLATEGFLPGYGMYDGGIAATPGAMGAKKAFQLTRSPSLAVREFVPGNMIYANRGRFRAARYHFPVGEQQLRPDVYVVEPTTGRVRFHGQSASGYTDPGAGRLEVFPISDVDLAYLSPIRDDELERFQLAVAVFGYARNSRRGGTSYTVNGKVVKHVRGQGLRLVDVGPASSVRAGELGFPVCRICGAARSPFSSATELENFRRIHADRCGRAPEPLGFSADIAVDSLVFNDLADEAAAVNLVEAIRTGAAQILDMEAEDLQYLTVPTDGAGVDCYLYDPMRGGSGLLDQIIDRWNEVVAAAVHVTGKCPNACERACYDCLCTGRNVYWHRFLDRHGAHALLQQFNGAPTAEFELQPQVETGPATQTRGTHDVEDRLGRYLARAGFHGFGSQQPVDIGPPYDRTVPDFMFDDPYGGSRVAVYIDGLSAGIHGNARQQHVDAIIRDQLEDRGWAVVQIPSSHLDDPEALTLDFKKLARALQQKDHAQRIEADPSWYADDAEDSNSGSDTNGLLGEFEHELEGITDDSFRSLLSGFVRDGGPVPVFHDEFVGHLVDIAWPEPRVAVLADADDDTRHHELTEAGWRVLRVNGLTVDELRVALGLGDAETRA